MVEPVENILLVDKPKGITSFDVIRKLRRELGVKRMGHAGTLDPLASGLLLVGVREGTKKLYEYLKLPKTYEVEILVGKRTTTGDLEGEVVEEAVVENLNSAEVEEVLRGLVGTIELPVPVYSAVKQKGRSLYQLAREGKTVEPPIKKMEIKNIKSYDISYENRGWIIKTEMEVGSGTYIRSVAEEVGRRLGYPATVSELRRTKIGAFEVIDARPV